MGRKPFSFADEHIALMGKVPDKQVADAAGCVYMTVINYRKKHNIPPPPRKKYERSVEFTAPYTRFLGIVPDSDLANAFGITRQAVGFARKARGFVAPVSSYELHVRLFEVFDSAEVGKTKVSIPRGVYETLVATVAPRKETT